MNFMPPCLALSIIRYGSRVSGAIQEKVAISPTPCVVTTQKESSGHPQLQSANLYIYIHTVMAIRVHII